MKHYDIAAYIWPAYTGDEPRTRLFWEEGIGEWQTVKNMQFKPCGYTWNRKHLWGYVNEADIDRDYAEILPDVKKKWAKIKEEFSIPYYPHVCTDTDI